MTLLLLACTAARGASINVGSHLLHANTPNQVVTIQVSGGEQIAGEDFFAQIGDGGTFVGGTNSKPQFTSVDILSGTIFAANNNGAFGDPNGTSPPGSNAAHPLIWVDATTTNSGTVPASGLLATLVVDTTGLNSGTFPLRLTGVASSLGPFDTTLRDGNGDPIPLSLSNGSLTIATFPIGDYNDSGVVDAADYTVWRDHLGQFIVLANEDPAATPGNVTQEDYGIWKSHFDEVAAGAGGASFGTSLTYSAVPESTTLWSLTVGVVAAINGRATRPRRPLPGWRQRR